MPRSPERRKLLESAVKIYGELSTGIGKKEEPYYRLVWKYAARQAEVDPDAAKRFFKIMEARGYGGWGEEQWGYRAKMAEVKKSLAP